MSRPSSEPRLAILGYHKVGPAPGGWDTWFYIPEETFVRQLETLVEEGWEVIDHATFLQGLSSLGAWPPRAALLTFDDGCRSLLDVAVPQLRRFGFPAVIYVPTDFIGARNTWDQDVEPEEAICGWEELRELARSEVSVQSHGASHRAFSSLDPVEQADELRRSKRVLEDGLDQPAESFSFPYGDNGADPEAVAAMLARAGYRAACLYGGGPHTAPVVDPYALNRVAMGPDTDLRVELAA